MKLTLENIKKIKRETDNNLTKRVCNYVVDKWTDYTDKKYIFTDVLSYGCQSGIVSDLTYFSQTRAFYKKYNEEINEILQNLLWGLGVYDMTQIFGKNWDTEDPLAIDDHNQNLLAWFGFEETLRNIGYEFECLRDVI